MKKIFKSAIAVFAMAAMTNIASAQTIVDVAVGSKEHSTLVAAVKAAGLVETLQGTGPFTVFAPVNSAFAKLPEGTVATLLKPENKATLTAVLTYHVVAGNLMAADVLKAIEAGGGKATVTTVQGASLTAAVEGGKVVLTDAAGNKSTVVATDLKASNGVIHVIDTVVLPSK
ncbi:MAG: fasciclin domain-containing protein [Chitinophagaceae bacterium]|jgi:uncharacterized surface protein with fasciclin (FAS1) repeats|nr:fasciclin domain-containing protein [Chitinophagaceae bacterium]